MSRLLTSPLARFLFLVGLFLGSLRMTRADEGTLQRTADPVLLPIPESEPAEPGEDESLRLELPLSESGQKLVLVSAEIDDRADQPRVTQVERGSSSRKLRKVAFNDLPMRHLTPQQQRIVTDVVDSVSVFRRLPAFQCELDPRVHDYFTAHPDVAVSIWRAMAISQLEMTQINDSQYELDTRDGTTGVVTVLHQSRESCLVFCEGMFKSPFLKEAIHARSLMHLRTSFGTDQEGRIYATHQADLFVAFPSQKVGTIAKLISPVSNAIIDRNFQEVSLFIHVMWLAMTKQPGWVEQIASRLNGVPGERSDELIQLTAEVYVTAQTNLRKRVGLPVSLESIRPTGAEPSRTSGAGIPIDVTR